MKTHTVLLIGSGKLAHHLNHWFHLYNKSNSLLTWDRHQDPHALRRNISVASHVWLAISDSALVPFYEKYLAGHETTVVHFSGALHDERLISAHPLMSFTNELYPDDFYKKIQFALTGAKDLKTALPHFENSFFSLRPSDKALYHALCVLAGNFPQMLWNEVYNYAQSLQIPAAALDIYIQKITQNFIDLKTQALTGPFIRNDQKTIEKNVEALKGTLLQNIYQSFQKEFSK